MLVGSYTGLRYQNLSSLTKDNFKLKENRIEYFSGKGREKKYVQLHKTVKDILKKYDYVSPYRKSSQLFNKKIQKIGKLAGLNENIIINSQYGSEMKKETKKKYEMLGSHTCRRSFCTNQFKKGIPHLIIMQASGHKTEKEFLKYIRVSEIEAQDVVAKAWKKYGF